VKKKFGILIFVVSILFSACSTDFEVLGDWKETMIVYGLLDQSKPKQYIKINKAFLGEGNAMEFAQVKDSVQFSHALSVTLQKVKNGIVSTYPLSPDNSISKDNGSFYGPDQANAIYSFNSTGTSAIDQESIYKLIVRNTETGKEVTSQTAIVADFGTLDLPSPFATVASVVTNTETYRYQIKFKSAKNARIYQIIIRFNYKDSTVSGTTNKILDWVFPQKETTTLNGLEEMDFGFVGQDYMRYIGSSLSDYTGLVQRIPGNIEIVVISAGDELNTYINVNKPSTGIIQEKPEYTNISEGLGIFSSRHYKVPFNRPMSTEARDVLSSGQYTKCLKFIGSNGTWSPCN
jgi:hypothetical protein